jgi:hypothetical protein
MTAGRYNIDCVKGSPLSKTLTIKNPDNQNADLNVWGSRMQVRETSASSTTTLELTTSNGRLERDVDAATISISLSSDETDSLAVGSYVYDLELYTTEGAPTVLRLVQGFFTVS